MQDKTAGYDHADAVCRRLPTHGSLVTGRPSLYPACMIDRNRITELNDLPVRPHGDYVLYWMQAAQRTRCNHALQFAIERANDLKRPVLVFFGIAEDYPCANLRHYRFMLEGLQEVKKDFEAMKVPFAVRRGAPQSGAAELARDACLVVADDAHLPHLRTWRNELANTIPCRLYEVATNLIVPVHIASEKEEYSAATFRPRITRMLPQFLIPLKRTACRVVFSPQVASFDIDCLDAALAALNIDTSVKPVDSFHGGTTRALKLLRDFISHKLAGYSSGANDPTRDCLSKLSPYLHFGQISPIEIALAVSKTRSRSKADYLEQLIVRRELAHNFTRYNQKAACYEGLPAWCRRTLDFHHRDRREYIYSQAQFEHGATHDAYWNAAQRQMVATGSMHGYMRMYWGKKILEWPASPAEAFRIALYLNDKYELDGRDANGITGVAWCFGKHDRPWAERPVFGKIRYMNAAGLRRKFDPDKYAQY
ncbi:MAG TPA: deoxyribodipyrimidine photo-lyase [Sedimentisphaerales bacterium]|nr:deoxyribodipyrimidine photo-lyase [Sedimentisphaerales bacterium]